jgi:hypothetical protein
MKLVANIHLKVCDEIAKENGQRHRLINAGEEFELSDREASVLLSAKRGNPPKPIASKAAKVAAPAAADKAADEKAAAIEAAAIEAAHDEAHLENAALKAKAAKDASKGK